MSEEMVLTKDFLMGQIKGLQTHVDSIRSLVASLKDSPLEGASTMRSDLLDQIVRSISVLKAWKERVEREFWAELTEEETMYLRLEIG